MLMSTLKNQSVQHTNGQIVIVNNKTTCIYFHTENKTKVGSRPVSPHTTDSLSLVIFCFSKLSCTSSFVKSEEFTSNSIVNLTCMAQTISFGQTIYLENSVAGAICLLDTTYNFVRISLNFSYNKLNIIYSTSTI